MSDHDAVSRIQWNADEKQAVINEAFAIAPNEHGLRKAVFDQAQRVLPANRRRKISGVAAVPWYTQGFLAKKEQAEQLAREREAREKAEAEAQAMATLARERQAHQEAEVQAATDALSGVSTGRIIGTLVERVVNRVVENHGDDLVSWLARSLPHVTRSLVATLAPAEAATTEQHRLDLPPLKPLAQAPPPPPPPAEPPPPPKETKALTLGGNHVPVAVPKSEPPAAPPPSPPAAKGVTQTAGKDYSKVTLPRIAIVTVESGHVENGIRHALDKAAEFKFFRRSPSEITPLYDYDLVVTTKWCDPTLRSKLEATLPKNRYVMITGNGQHVTDVLKEALRSWHDGR